MSWAGSWCQFHNSHPLVALPIVSQVWERNGCPPHELVSPNVVLIPPGKYKIKKENLSHMSRSSVWSMASSTTASQSSFQTGSRLLFTTWLKVSILTLPKNNFMSKLYRALPVLAAHREITEGVRVSNEVHLHQIPGRQVFLWIVVQIYICIHYFGLRLKLLSLSFVHAVLSLLFLPCLHKGYP